MRVVGQIAGADVALGWREGHQVVLVAWPGLLEVPRPLIGAPLPLVGLVQLLGGGRYVQDDAGSWWAEIVHTEELDRLLVELVDLFAEIRVSHPRMVQLPLRLEDSREGDGG